MRYLEYNRKVCYILSTIPNPNSKNPFPADGYTLSTPYLHISIILNISNISIIIELVLYYIIHIIPSTHIFYKYYISFIYPNYLSFVNPLLWRVIASFQEPYIFSFYSQLIKYRR